MSRFGLKVKWKQNHKGRLIPLPPQPKLQWLRKKAPQIIVVAAVVALTVLVLLELVEDSLIEGTPVTVGPFGALFNGIVFFTHNVTTTISSWSYTGVFALMLLEATSLPIPSEVILPFVGYLVSLGDLNFWVAVAVATAAGVAGSIIDYYIGLKAAHILSKHRILGKVFFTQNQLNIAVRWFGKYGAVFVFFSRLIPGFRTIVSFPAGAVKMPLPKFTVYTTLGCLVWNGLLIYVGYWLGSQWTTVAGVSHNLIIAVAAVLAVLFGVFLVWRHRRIKRAAASAA
jgi:membrane protein DedA with SNARE-associated domain